MILKIYTIGSKILWKGFKSQKNLTFAFADKIFEEVINFILMVIFFFFSISKYYNYNRNN
jgi:hypothetical protein